MSVPCKRVHIYKLWVVVSIHLKDSPQIGIISPNRDEHFTNISVRIQSPQMMIGVYNHLRNERYLGSMLPFWEGDWIPRVYIYIYRYIYIIYIHKTTTYSPHPLIPPITPLVLSSPQHPWEHALPRQSVRQWVPSTDLGKSNLKPSVFKVQNCARNMKKNVVMLEPCFRNPGSGFHAWRSLISSRIMYSPDVT